MYGKKHTLESRQKMSDALSGENSPNYGKPRSEETKKRISESNKEFYFRKRIEKEKESGQIFLIDL